MITEKTLIKHLFNVFYDTSIHSNSVKVRKSVAEDSAGITMYFMVELAKWVTRKNLFYEMDAWMNEDGTVYKTHEELIRDFYIDLKIGNV